MTPPASATNGVSRATTRRRVFHCWRFTPASFRLVVDDLADLGLTTLGIVQEHDTVGCEFFTTLGHSTTACGRAARRDPSGSVLRLERSAAPALRAGSRPAPFTHRPLRVQWPWCRPARRPRIRRGCITSRCPVCPHRWGGRAKELLPWIDAHGGRRALGAAVLTVILAATLLGITPAGGAALVGRSDGIPLNARTSGCTAAGCPTNARAVARSSTRGWDASHTADTAASQAHNQWADQHAENGRVRARR